MKTYKPKHCAVCGKLYTPTGPCSKYCSKECYKTVFNQQYHSAKTYEHSCRTGKSAAPGVGSGNGSGFGAVHHNYKNGNIVYKQYKLSACEHCGSTETLCVHHKDGDRHNNNEENLQTLCRSCHAKDHSINLNFTRKYYV